jgi:RNase adapter protein RapZ
VSTEPPRESPARRAGDLAADGRRALGDARELVRELLAELGDLATVIDTSQLRSAQLRLWMRDMVRAGRNRLTLVFESFAFKHGVPLDADYVFDMRVLPNPHWVPELQALTGRDAPVADYLRAQPEVGEMLAQIEAFLARWLPAFEADQRSYLTVAIGCTGGQHRSVYFAEVLAQRFAARSATLVRHRELDARG